MAQSTVDALGWDDRLKEAFSEHDANGLSPARVVAQHRGVCVVRGEDGEAPAVVRGRLSDQALLAGGLPAVGDWVAVARPLNSSPVIEAVLPRASCVTRKKAWQEADEQVLVANVDTLLLVSDFRHDFNLRRLERYVAVAYESGAAPVIVLTKLDLRRDPALLVAAESVAIGLPVLAVSNITGEGLDELERLLLPGLTVALIGSSGVGKSTLINRLAGSELMPTREIREDGRGRHTTRHRQLHVLPGGALLVDTPGLRELQLWEGDLDGAFADVVGLEGGCRFSDCAHESEPGCAVLAAIAAGDLDPVRLASYRKLQRELQSIEARRDRRVWAERKRRWKQRSREARHARRYGA